MKLSVLVADARKGLVAFVGAAGEALSLGLLHGSAERWTTAAVGIATALLVYRVPNGSKKAPAVPAPPVPPAA